MVELPPRPDLTPGPGEALGLVTFSERREMVLALRGSEPTLPRNEALSHPVQRSLFELSAVLGELYYDLMNAGRTEEAIELRYLLVVADAARHTYRTDDGIMAIVRHEVLASPQADAILARPGARPLLQPDD